MPLTSALPPHCQPVALDKAYRLMNHGPTVLVSASHAGVANVKKAYEIYKEKGWTTKMLSAAYRHHLHWSEFIGGDMVMTIPYKYQKMFNTSDVEVVSRIDDPVAPAYIEELRKIPDFVKGYDGMDIADFDTYGPVNKTLDQFAGGYDDLVKIIRKFMIKY